MGRLPNSSEESFRLSLLGGLALTPGPEPSNSTFPSNSSSGNVDPFLAGLGSFDGWVGYGMALKYG